MASGEMRLGRKVRLVLQSDGVANVGETGPESILKVVDDYGQRNATLTTIAQTAAAAEFAELLRRSFWAQCGDLDGVEDLLATVASDLDENSTYRELRDLVARADQYFEPYCAN